MSFSFIDFSVINSDYSGAENYHETDGVCTLVNQLLVASKSLLVFYLEDAIAFAVTSPFILSCEVCRFCIGVSFRSHFVIVFLYMHSCCQSQRLYLLWAYYAASLIPLIPVFQVVNGSMADRYTYLPSAGLFLIVGLALAWC